MRPLGSADDVVLRRAFGRFGAEEARLRGAEVVRRHQQQAQWFFCDCRPDQTRPPVLVPVAESHVRRHGEEPWASHAPACDFFLDAAEQSELVRSYDRRQGVQGLRLLRRFAEDRVAAPEVPGLKYRTYDRRRESLARLLTNLVVEAGLQRLGGGFPPPVGEQFKAIRRAAREVELDRDVRLSDWLCTWRPDLATLLARLDQAPEGTFPRGRVCGVLIATAAGYGAGVLHMTQGDPVPVRGHISVWAEPHGVNADPAEGERARAPYLAACLIGQPAPGEPAEVLRAYLHPCVSRAHLLLVDSDLERRTLEQLRRLQDWLATRRHMNVQIEKPLHDIAPEDAEAREPCIPDWILRADQVPSKGHSVVVVETMGSDNVEYRDRKLRTQNAMARLLGHAAPAAVVLHEFYGSVGQAQEDRDRRCWAGARWALTGPEAGTGL